MYVGGEREYRYMENEMNNESEICRGQKRMI
jgi:hypothetical protein